MTRIYMGLLNLCMLSSKPGTAYYGVFQQVFWQKDAKSRGGQSISINFVDGNHFLAYTYWLH